MKTVRIILLVISIILITIQLIPNKLPETKGVTSGDIAVNGLIPQNISAILRASCYDCHSYETHFPWYSRLAPSSWLLARDITRGRDKLNFSEWDGYNKRHKIGRLESIKKEVTSGDMPLPAYIFMHRKARLTSEQISALSKWTDEFTAKIMQ